jgi:hypothetical protein
MYVLAYPFHSYFRNETPSTNVLSRLLSPEHTMAVANIYKYGILAVEEVLGLEIVRTAEQPESHETKCWAMELSPYL